MIETGRQKYQPMNVFVVEDKIPPIHDRNLYLAKRWYRRAMLHNSGVQDYVDNHTHNERTHTGSRNTPLEMIRN